MAEADLIGEQAVCVHDEGVILHRDGVTECEGCGAFGVRAQVGVPEYTCGFFGRCERCRRRRS